MNIGPMPPLCGRSMNKKSPSALQSPGGNLLTPNSKGGVMEKIQIKEVFVNTRNVRNFQVLMDGLALGEGEGRLGMVVGRAGLGKTRTAIKYHADNPGSVFIRIIEIFKGSQVAFLQKLCRELGVKKPPARKAALFYMAVDRLIANPQPVFLDEMERMPYNAIELIRDLSDASTAPFVAIGEAELDDYMRRNDRVWSRTFQTLDFEPVSVTDIVGYLRDATGIQLTPKVGGLIHHETEGDWRLVKRATLALTQNINARGKGTEVSMEMAKIALKTGLRG